MSEHFGNDALRQETNAGKADMHILHSLPAALIRRGNIDPVHKIMQHSGRQFLQVGIFLRPEDELLNAVGFFLLLGNLLFQKLHFLRQFCLLIFIIGGQLFKSAIIDFAGDIDLQSLLNDNAHKSIKNLVSELVPKSFGEFILKKAGIAIDEKCHKIDGKTRDKILELLQNFAVTITGTDNAGEVVTCGGVALDEVNSKTMESKLVDGLYFIGEVLDIDGFCGGFNLQNCWSTAFVAACGVKSVF